MENREFKVVYFDHNGSNYRIVNAHSELHLERSSKDALGDLCWNKHPIESVRGGFQLYGQWYMLWHKYADSHFLTTTKCYELPKDYRGVLRFIVEDRDDDTYAYSIEETRDLNFRSIKHLASAQGRKADQVYLGAIAILVLCSQEKSGARLMPVPEVSATA